VLSSLIYYTRDIELAEDALQDACEQAAMKWPQQGSPDNPAAWLHTVAKRKLIDKLRQGSSRKAEHTIGLIRDSFNHDAAMSESAYSIPDERLRLIFTCCHPALNEQARVALTLKTLCGLSTKQIARAYLSTEIAITQRLTRARRKIRDGGIAYEIPDGESLEQRLPSVLAVIYLIYNESYSAYESQTLTRAELAAEAIRLGRILVNLLPRAEVAGLLALMLFHDARREARSNATHPYIPLEQQDRSLWKQDAIQEANDLLVIAMLAGKPDSFQVQAAISALHCSAKSWVQTDWRQIQLLYSSLYKMAPSAIILLNQAVAYAHGGDPEHAYSRIKALYSQLHNYQPYYAARAEVESRLSLIPRAIESYDHAISLSQNNVERDFLVAKRRSLG
jgi:RNA polymerase sigma-70 factor (ECF subfamily)